MRRSLVSLVLSALVLAACGWTAPTERPSTEAPLATPSPTTEPGPIAPPAAAFVVTLDRRPGGASFDTLLVEAVGPDGSRTPVSRLVDVTAGLSPGTSIATWVPILVHPRGLLAVPVEGGEDEPGHEAGLRVLIFDLRDPTRPPLAIVGGGRLGWSPTGRLAIVGGLGVTFVDPVRGEQVLAAADHQIDASATWTADGTGVLATRIGPQDEIVPGILRPDGTFADTIARPWSATGSGRPYGRNGSTVGDAWSSGPLGGDHAIVESVRGSDEIVAWIVVTSPSDDPEIQSWTWDAAGTGLWVVLGRDGEATLAHIPAPGDRDDRATFPLTGWPEIVGVAPDDGAVIVEIQARTAGDRPALLRVDAVTGAVLRIDRDPERSRFSGWAAIP